MMKVCVLFLLAALPALCQFTDARSLQHQPIKAGMTCASDAYVLTWVAAHNQFECLAASGAPTGAAGGVLGGTYPSPTFAGGASFNANAATFLNGAGSFTSPGTANARITFSNVASATMTLTGVAVKAVVTCWDSSVSPARLFIPDSVEQTDADTLTFNFSPNATGYCDGSTGIGLTGATGPTGPAGGVTSVFGSTGVITTLANPAFTGTMTVGTSLSVDGTTGIATSSKVGNAALSLLTGAGKWSSGVPVGQAACADLSNASAACSSLTNLTLVTPNIGAATGTSLTVTGAVTSGSGSGVGGAFDLTQGTLPSIVANTVSIVAPTSVTGYEIVMPGAAATGIRHLSNAANVVTESVGLIVNADITNSTIDLTAKVTGVLPLANGGTGSATLAGAGICVAGSDCSFTASQSITKSINATSTDGFIVQNTTAAINGTQQWSPRVRLTGHGFKTTGSVDQADDWIIENQTIQGSGNSTSMLAFSSQIAAGGYVPQIYFTSGAAAGGITNAILFGGTTSSFPALRKTSSATTLDLILADGSAFAGLNTAGINANASINTASSTDFYWGSSSVLSAPSNGIVKMSNFGKTDFTRLDFGGTTSSFGAFCITNQANPIITACDATGGNTTTFKANSYQSSDGSTGATVTTCTAFKNGLCVSGT